MFEFKLCHIPSFCRSQVIGLRSSLKLTCNVSSTPLNLLDYFLIYQTYRYPLYLNWPLSETLALPVSGMIPEIVAKWVSGHGMPSSYLCLTSSEVDESVTKQSSSVHSQHPSLLTCRSLSVSSNPISSELLTLYCHLSLDFLTKHGKQSLSVWHIPVLSRSSQ